MAEAMRSRFALDLDNIERQLNHSAQQSAPAQRDPLSELARIVGQDDPFSVLLAPSPADRRPTREPAPEPLPSVSFPQNWETAYEPEPHGHDPAYGAVYDQPEAQHAPYQGYTLRGSAAAVDESHVQHYGASFDGAGSHPAHDGGRSVGYAEYMPVDAGYGQSQSEADPSAYAEQERYSAPPRSRKTLMAIGAALGVAVLGAGGAYVFRGGGSHAGANGEPPIVTAAAGPVKVAPQNPGGVEIPDQNKQIYDRSGQDAPTKIVSREEQPIDVKQAARVASAGIGPLPSGGVSSVTPAPAPSQNGEINAALGEPRRVRTVSVSPDGAMKSPGASVASAGPATTGATPSASSTPALPPQRPRDTAVTTPQAPPAAAPSAMPDATRAAKPPQKVAAAAEPTTQAGSAAELSSGGYLVQLAVRPSEKEAKTAFQQLQQRHGDELAGRSPAIRKAEVNGSTVYRVRVGPMARDEASSLCSKLQASGGQCFVAKN